MAYTKKVSGLNMYIKGTGTILALLAFLVGLSSYGIHVTASGDQVCAGTSQEPCVSYFNITSEKYNLIFNTAVVYFDDVTGMTFQVYKRGLTGTKYAFDTTGQKWSKFSLTSGKAGNVTNVAGGVNQFMLVGYKTDLTKTVKWGVKAPGLFGTTIVDADPLWSGYSQDQFFTELVENKADITGGFAIFKFTNPTTFSIPVSALTADIMPGTGAKPTTSVKLTEHKTWTESVSTKTWEPNVACTTAPTSITDNGTVLYTQTCADNGKYVTASAPVVKTSETALPALLAPGKSITVKITATWPASTGNNGREWVPKIDVSGTTLTQPKWAWWSASWQYKTDLTKIGTNPLGQMSLTAISGWSRAQVKDNCEDLRYLDPTEAVIWPFSNGTASTGGATGLACNTTDVVVELFNNGTSTTFLYWGNAAATTPVVPSPISVGTQGTDWEVNVTGLNGQYFQLRMAKSGTYTGSLISGISFNQTNWPKLLTDPGSQFAMMYDTDQCYLGGGSVASLIQTVDLPTRKMFNFTRGPCQMNITFLAGLNGFTTYLYINGATGTGAQPLFTSLQYAASGTKKFTNMWQHQATGVVAYTLGSTQSGVQTAQPNRPWFAYVNTTDRSYLASFLTIPGTVTQMNEGTDAAWDMTRWIVPGSTGVTSVNVFGTNATLSATSDKHLNDTFDMWKLSTTFSTTGANQNVFAPTIDNVNVLPLTVTAMNVTTCRANVTAQGESIASVYFNVTQVTNSSAYIAYGNGTTPYAGGTTGSNWTTGNFQPSLAGTNILNCTVVAQGVSPTLQSARTTLFTVGEAAPSLIGSVIPTSPYYLNQANFVCNYTTGAGGSPASSKIPGATVYVQLDGYNRTATEETNGYTYTNSTAAGGDHTWQCIGYKTNYRALTTTQATATVLATTTHINNVTLSGFPVTYGNVTACTAAISIVGQTANAAYFNVTYMANSSLLTAYANGTTTDGMNWTSGSFQAPVAGASIVNCTVLAVGSIYNATMTQLFTIDKASGAMAQYAAKASPQLRSVANNFVCNYTTGAAGNPANTKIAGATVAFSINGVNRAATEEAGGYTYTNSTFDAINTQSWSCAATSANYASMQGATEYFHTINSNPTIVSFTNSSYPFMTTRYRNASDIVLSMFLQDLDAADLSNLKSYLSVSKNGVNQTAMYSEKAITNGTSTALLNISSGNFTAKWDAWNFSLWTSDGTVNWTFSSFQTFTKAIDMNRSLGTGINNIEFSPQSYIEQDVAVTNQTSAIGAYFFWNNGTEPLRIGSRLGNTTTGYTYGCGSTNVASAATTLSLTYTSVFSAFLPNTTGQGWCWLDLNNPTTGYVLTQFWNVTSW